MHKIFLANDHIEHGIGKKLMKVMCEKFDENIIVAQLTTDTNNKAMQRLAERVGFSEKELIKGYYRENEDRWLYKRASL